MQNPLVSVVVPVWQSEKTICTCVESILCQDYLHLQIVLVDDGSTDQSGKLMDELAKEDERIQVVHQQNAGASAARWKGVELSKGEWVCFVDSDDCLPKSAISDLLSKASDEVDIVFGNGNSLPHETRELISIEDFRHLAVRAEGTIGVPWGSLYRRNILKYSYFDLPREIVSGEDYLFWLHLVFNTEKPVAILYKEVYDKGPDTISSHFRWTSDYALKFNKLRKAAIPVNQLQTFLPDVVNDALSNFFSITLYESRNIWQSHTYLQELKNDMEHINRHFTIKENFFLNIPSCKLRRLFSNISQWLSCFIFFVGCFFLLALPASYEIVEGERHFAKLLFAIASIQSVALLAILYYINKLVFRKTNLFSWLFFILFLILFCVETFSYFKFNSRLNSFVLAIILQTNLHEIKDFFTTYVLQPIPLLFISLGILLLCAFCFLIKKIGFGCHHSKFSWKDGLLILLSILLFGWLSFNKVLPPGQNTVVRFVDSYVALSENKLDLDVIATENAQFKATTINNDSITIILVIGESFNKYHSSLYGYSISTNPLLEKERDANRLLVFTDAVSPANFTNQAMQYLFFLKNCDGKENTRLSHILFPNVFRKAGYKVNYFDNQYSQISGGTFDYSCGYFLNPLIIHKQCFNYRSDILFNDDGDFLNYYADDIHQNGRVFTIIHLYGQHIPVEGRYPKNYKKISADVIKRKDLTEEQREEVACYDNATRYHDEQLARIFEMFKKDDAVIVYLSDHGDQVYDDYRYLRGRDLEDDFSPAEIQCLFEIPMMVWCSDKFKTIHSEEYQQLKAATDKPFCSDDTAWLLFSLAGIRFEGYQPWRSPLNDDYYPHQRMLKGKVRYDKNKIEKHSLLIN